ncbi:hypothetical protein LINPERPRIM_LOCUS17803 [Linum perenne]
MSAACSTLVPRCSAFLAVVQFNCLWIDGLLRADSVLKLFSISEIQVPFQVPLEVNVVLVGFGGDGGYRYNLNVNKFEEFLKLSFPTHRPSCLETGEPLDIEHHLIYNVFPAGQAELIALEKALKEAMVPAGSARETDFGREVPLFEVEATSVEPVFHKFYSYIFDTETELPGNVENDRPDPVAIFLVNFDKVRMDPRNKEIDLDRLMFSKIDQLSEEDMKKQEGDYIYRYKYNGGGASQVWLSSERYCLMDDLSFSFYSFINCSNKMGGINLMVSTR